MINPLEIWCIGVLPASVVTAAFVGVTVALAAHATPQVPAPESLISELPGLAGIAGSAVLGSFLLVPRVLFTSFKPGDFFIRRSTGSPAAHKPLQLTARARVFCQIDGKSDRRSVRKLHSSATRDLRVD
jgi:hypothetical protein